MAAAGADGAAALQGLAASAVAAGGGLSGSHSDDEEAEGDAALTPAAKVLQAAFTPATAAAAAATTAAAGAAAAAPAAARKPVYGVSAELAAIALEADPTLGPLIVQALATSRKQPSMTRAFMKNVEAEDDAAKTMEAIWPTLGDHDRTKFQLSLIHI